MSLGSLYLYCEIVFLPFVLCGLHSLDNTEWFQRFHKKNPDPSDPAINPLGIPLKVWRRWLEIGMAISGFRLETEFYNYFTRQLM